MKPARPSHIQFDGNMFRLDEIWPRSHPPMVVVGGGVIGLEYAIMFATLGVNVTVVDGRDRLLDCDNEIEILIHHARSLGMTFRLGEEVIGIDVLAQGMAVVALESGKRLIGETVLFSVGRVGDTADLNLSAAGLEPDERGRLWCNENHQTWAPHIYGAGDVVGFPALASVSMEQGRRAICHAFGEPYERFQYMPYGLFTIPEISMVGDSEEKLTADCVPYEVGVARYKEIARGHIIGDTQGMLKLLFHRQTRKLLGVHCIGEYSTEIVHIGQTVMALGGTMDYFRDAVFNYPTMAECYKVAAFDGLNKLCYDKLADANRANRVAAQAALNAEAISVSEAEQVAAVLA
jgi:NAD(P) transhydrogenase